jgi:hypothetical protein
MFAPVEVPGVHVWLFDLVLCCNFQGSPQDSGNEDVRKTVLPWFSFTQGFALLAKPAVTKGSEIYTIG